MTRLEQLKWLRSLPEAERARILSVAAEKMAPVYETDTGVSRATAKRDLDELVKLKLINLIGAGRSAH